jgi:hypothetical protein
LGAAAAVAGTNSEIMMGGSVNDGKKISAIYSTKKHGH